MAGQGHRFSGRDGGHGVQRPARVGVVEVQPQPSCLVLCDSGPEHLLGVVQNDRAQDGREGEQGEPDQGGDVAVGDRVVDDLPEHHGVGQRGQRGQDRQTDEESHPEGVGAQEREVLPQRSKADRDLGVAGAGVGFFGSLRCAPHRPSS